jgi:hypothetical protein
MRRRVRGVPARSCGCVPTPRACVPPCAPVLRASEYPYFNEPGYESQYGTPEGDENRRTAENGGYERLRVWTVQWAMVDQLRRPSPGFEDVIRKHFLL